MNIHYLDEDELAHVGKILKKGYVRIPSPKKRKCGRKEFLCAFFCILAVMFLILGAYCIYCVVNGLYLVVTGPGMIFSAILLGVCLLEIQLSLDDYMLPRLGTSKFTHKPTPLAFLIDQDENSQTPVSDSSYDLRFESFFKSSSAAEEGAKHSTSRESVAACGGSRMFRSVSQYEMDYITSEEHGYSQILPRSSSCASRKRLGHNFESEDRLSETRSSPPFQVSVSKDSTKTGRIPEKVTSVL